MHKGSGIREFEVDVITEAVGNGLRVMGINMEGQEGHN